MGRALGFLFGITPCRKVFAAVVFLFLALIGCGDSCVVIVSNPGGGGGTVLGSVPNCSLSTATGNVRLRVTSSLAPPSSGQPDRTEHIFVTIRGIEATANAFADANSPDWRELTPNLATQPAQVDLLAASGESCEGISFESAAVPADTYRQIRLSLAQNQPDQSESAPQGNSCGMAGPNCIETSDGAIRPLVFDSANSKLSQMQISPDHIRDFSDVREPADIYSAGATLFYLLTNKYPYLGFDPRQPGSYEIILQNPPVPLRAFRPDAPEGFERILLKSLQKQPRDRWKNAQLMADALRPFATPSNG